MIHELPIIPKRALSPSWASSQIHHPLTPIIFILDPTLALPSIFTFPSFTPDIHAGPALPIDLKIRQILIPLINHIAPLFIIQKPVIIILITFPQQITTLIMPPTPILKNISPHLYPRKIILHIFTTHLAHLRGLSILVVLPI